MISYKVRIWSILINEGIRSSSYTVRWKVGTEKFRETFAKKALADSFRSKLLIAQRSGIGFDTELGLPETELRTREPEPSVSFLQHAIEFCDVKWSRSSARERKSVADALATVTPALLPHDTYPAEPDQVRPALYGWIFNTARRTSGQPGPAIADTVEWLMAHTLNIEQLMDPVTVRRALDMLATLMNGKPAAANTVARKRAIFYALCKYAVERRRLATHPMSLISWTAPTPDLVIDRRVVANPHQASRLLAAVGEIAAEYVAYYGSMYYAALRPEEADHLNIDEYEPPKRPGGWGWLHLTGAIVETGIGWNDTDEPREQRGLKHRDRKTTRDVPVCPELAALLDTHIDTFPTAPDGRLFVNRRGPFGRRIESPSKPISSSTRSLIWNEARKRALNRREYRSPLARRPYDLRHACLSLWLNAGVAATQVAEWAGQSVKVLLTIYAKCMVGGIKLALQQIAHALAHDWSDEDASI